MTRGAGRRGLSEGPAECVHHDVERGEIARRVDLQ